MVKNYVNSVYFMTTTMSTVGYGDINARRSDDPIWALDMIYMILVIVMGIITFSSVSNDIFSYRPLESANKTILKRVRKT